MRLFLILLLLCNIGFAEGDDCKLYPSLTEDECHELFIIQRNYHYYDQSMQQVAQRRVREIKRNLLDNETKANAILNDITELKADLIPVAIINDVMQSWKDYIKLPLKVQKELIYYLLGSHKNDLSVIATEYMENRKPFIMTKITNGAL